MARSVLSTTACICLAAMAPLGSRTLKQYHSAASSSCPKAASLCSNPLFHTLSGSPCHLPPAELYWECCLAAMLAALEPHYLILQLHPSIAVPCAGTTAVGTQQGSSVMQIAGLRD